MYDVVIVGAGAAGLSAALVLGRQKRSVLVVDGGQPRNAPAAEMHMYLGRDGGAPAHLLADGRAEIEAYPTVERISGQVGAVGGADGAFEVTIDDGMPVQLVSCSSPWASPTSPGRSRAWRNAGAQESSTARSATDSRPTD